MKEFLNGNSPDIERSPMRKDKNQSFRISNSNKANIYVDMVKNRKKLNEKRNPKKKSFEYSLLGRINNLQQHQDTIFVMRNSCEKQKFDKG